jgi:hypothetical protein
MSTAPAGVMGKPCIKGGSKNCCLVPWLEMLLFLREKATWKKHGAHSRSTAAGSPEGWQSPIVADETSAVASEAARFPQADEPRSR